MHRNNLPVYKKCNTEEARTRLETTGLSIEYFEAFEQKEHDYHTHEFVEILFVLNGRFQHIIEEQHIDESAGGVTILNYNQYHSLKTPNGGVELVNLYWNPSIYPAPEMPAEIGHLLYRLIPQHPALGHHLNRVRHLIIEDHETIVSLLKMLLKEQNSSLNGRSAVMESLFKLILIELCRALPSELRHGPQQADYRVEKVRSYLDLNYRDSVCLADLCTLSGMKPANLCRRFKAHTGMTTGEYLTQNRLGAAIKMLRETEFKIVNISYDCGFTDVSRFNKVFKDTFDCSPSEYRKKGL